ncbi:MAG: thioredoxin-dependent thiol peroxidase [bacterium]
MKAPDFSLQDQTDTTRKLSDYAGKWLVVYFYPKDDTPGCTKEACSFRDSGAVFAEQDVAVVGISADSVASHAKFAEKYHLTFTLLSDPTKETIRAYGSWGEKSMYGKLFEGIIRKTYLISPEGEIAKEYPKVTPDKHAEQILKDLEELR